MTTKKIKLQQPTDGYAKKANNFKSGEEKEMIVQIEQINDTPFTAVKLDENGWRIALGKKFILERHFNEIEEISEFLTGISWEVLINIAMIIADIRESDEYKKIREEELNK